MTSQQRRIVVVRHAKAEREAASDHDRRLTERGRGDAAAAASAVAAALGRPGDGRSVALVSSAARAVETWRLLAAGLPAGVTVEERVEEALFQTDAPDVTDLLAGLDDGVGAAVVVGHNPTLEDAVRDLVAGGEADALARLDEGLPTAAVAVLSYDGSWSDLRPDSCRLDGIEVGRA